MTPLEGAFYVLEEAEAEALVVDAAEAKRRNDDAEQVKSMQYL